MGYKLQWGMILVKEKTEIGSSDFITDQEPEIIIEELNQAINTLFERFEPLPYYDHHTYGI